MKAHILCPPERVHSKDVDLFPIAGVLKQTAKDKEADMASNRYLGITEAAGSPTGEDHFFFSLEKDIYDVGIPADAIDMVWGHYYKPSYLVRMKHHVPPAGIAFNAVRIDKHIRDDECSRIKSAILSAHPDVHHFDIYVFKDGLHFWILKLSSKQFNVLSCIPEYSGCREYRYIVDRIPVISQSHICYGMAVTRFRAGLEKEMKSV